MMLILFVFAGSSGEPGWSMGSRAGFRSMLTSSCGAGRCQSSQLTGSSRGIPGLRFFKFQVSSAELSRLQRRQQQRQQQQQQQLLGRGHHRLHRCHRLHCLHHLRVQAGCLQVAGGAVAEFRVFKFFRGGCKKFHNCFKLLSLFVIKRI